MVECETLLTDSPEDTSGGNEYRADVKGDPKLPHSVHLVMIGTECWRSSGPNVECDGDKREDAERDDLDSKTAKEDLLADFHLVHVSVCTGLVIPRILASRYFVPGEGAFRLTSIEPPDACVKMAAMSAATNILVILVWLI